MSKKIFYIIILLLAFITMFFFYFSKKPDNPHSENTMKEIKYVKIAGKILKVDLAMTPKARELGLSGRKTLAENEGMLFIFDFPAEYPFWMKDMFFSIDIIWINEEGKVVFIKENASPESYPKAFIPDGVAKYVLETPAGFSQKNNLRNGDLIQFLSS